MKTSIILKTISKLLLPFMMLFGIYIISFGDVSPGGGFQGGAILTTDYLAFYFISEDKNIDLTKWVKFEKVLFFLLIIAGFLSVLSKDVYFTNPILNDSMISKRVFFILLNLIIAAKVCVGLICIVESFIEEEDDGF